MRCPDDQQQRKVTSWPFIEDGLLLRPTIPSLSRRTVTLLHFKQQHTRKLAIDRRQTKRSESSGFYMQMDT